MKEARLQYMVILSGETDASTEFCQYFWAGSDDDPSPDLPSGSVQVQSVKYQNSIIFAATRTFSMDLVLPPLCNLTTFSLHLYNSSPVTSPSALIPAPPLVCAIDPQWPPHSFSPLAFHYSAVHSHPQPQRGAIPLITQLFVCPPLAWSPSLRRILRRTHPSQIRPRQFHPPFQWLPSVTILKWTFTPV